MIMPIAPCLRDTSKAPSKLAFNQPTSGFFQPTNGFVERNFVNHNSFFLYFKASNILKYFVNQLKFT